MERKTQVAYTAVLLHIRARLIQWQFNLAVCDFEDAIINSVEAVFGVEVQSCYFHYVNNLGSWARSNLTVYVLTQYPQLIDVIRHCCALPLLPQHLLQRGMNVIGREAMALGPFLYHTVRPFLQYVQSDWIWHVNRGRTLSVCGSDNRTNNASESNNHRMNLRLKVHHPNVYHLIRSFVEFEDTTIDDTMSLEIGIIPTRHRASSSITNDDNIRRLTAVFLRDPNPSDELIAEFLHAAAFSMENVAYDAMGFPRQRNNVDFPV
ncbi:uncharacterized protein LOC117648116 [Thrips palmi]|uniref:Uncharacterized protein LOC117648116 n=1 Tax=Thrips palmi TaxID=161013 RepID=A0A6P8Z7E9_THRPL|nr:uncharacterized protein LOC117648116 [Thrips palmi]